VAIVTFLAGFAVAYRIHAESPPIPARVVAEGGSTLFTGDDIMAGQHIFQKYAGGSPATPAHAVRRKHRMGAQDRRFVLTCQSRFRTATQNDPPVNSRRGFSVNLGSLCALRVAFV
jgi:hypothetical protein